MIAAPRNGNKLYFYLYLTIQPVEQIEYRRVPSSDLRLPIFTLGLPLCHSLSELSLSANSPGCGVLILDAGVRAGENWIRLRVRLYCLCSQWLSLHRPFTGL